MLSHQTTYRVIYGDTDAMGVAYNANYLRWFEIGRAELFRSIGLTYKTIEEQGYFLPLSEVNCKYLSSVRYDEELIIEAILDDSVRNGVRFNYVIHRREGLDIIAKGFTLHAFLNREGRVVRPPAFYRQVVQKKLREATPRLAPVLP